MSGALTELTSKLATRLDMGNNGQELFTVLKSTAFKGNPSDAQMTALLVVANQYGLNPWTKEIYAFPDNKNGIVPIVGLDGWARIINDNPLFDGMDFKQDDESCTCIIYRKDRSHPVSVTEYMSECRRDTGPWKSHPKRMLRHKATIQCARLAFGYSGIYDQDEAERIVESIDSTTGEVIQQKPSRQELPAYPEADFKNNLESWGKVVKSGRKTPDDLIAMVSTKGLLSDAQKQAIRDLAKPADVTDVQPKNEPTMTAAEQAAHDAFLADMGE